MIVRCPSCASRHDIPALQPGSGGMLADCPDCGHHWIEASPRRVIGSLLHPARPGEAPPPADLDLRKLALAAREARKGFQAARRRRFLRGAAWLGLGLAAASPAFAALAFPEHTVSAVPSSIALYDRLGWQVNVYGIDIRQVEIQHLLMDGKQVVAVKGEIANVSSSVRKIPWLRFGLRSNDNVELYHWTLDTGVRPLRPGESMSFVTRLASPPEAASNLEIRFARVEEIGSNTPP